MNPKPTGRAHRTARGVELEIKRQFRAPIEDVWESVTDPQSTARWIGPWSGDSGPGKTVKLQMVFEDGDASSDVLIEVCEPPHRLVVSTNDQAGQWRLELVLRQDGETTELSFLQHDLDPSMAGEVGPGWEYYLDMLVAARAGTTRPQFSDYYPAQRAHFLEQLSEDSS